MASGEGTRAGVQQPQPRPQLQQQHPEGAEGSSDDTAYREFRVVVKNIAGDITDPTHLEQLGFLEAMSLEEVKGKSALALLSAMIQKGRFSYTDLEPLKQTLRDIDRPDLVREVDKYQHKYMYSNAGE